MKRKIAIDLEGVSKKYCRNLKRSLWYSLKDIGKDISGLSKPMLELRKHEFWALHDISFQLEKGVSIGIMGHNGAGKTTLLKLISGLIKPSAGKITINGSVGALIALGMGFNPILSGRENIWIAGAVTGYNNREISKRIDEIIAFSEIEDFIDSPVQSYSSGMVARLGFSIAIHVQPDILLVDEVLAVGDLNFAIKCYRKILEFRRQGGSIMLVSHNPYAIRTNCDRAIWIEKGKIKEIGKAIEVCGAYEEFVGRTDNVAGEKRYLDDSIIISKVDYPPEIFSGDKFPIELEVISKREIDNPIISVSIFNVSGQNIISNYSDVDHINIALIEGVNKFRLTYEKLFLMRGVYYINLVIAERVINDQLAALINCFKFEVKSNIDAYGAGMFKLQPVWEQRS